MSEDKPGMVSPEVARDRATGAGMVMLAAGISGLISWWISGSGWQSAVIAGGLLGLIMLLAASSGRGHR
jgi:hypothetical protein